MNTHQVYWLKIHLIIGVLLLIGYPLSPVVSAGIFERDYVMSNTCTKGFRAMTVSSDGKHLAAGDCEGNLHLYNLHTSDYIYLQVPCAPKFETLFLFFFLLICIVIFWLC